MNNLAVLAKSFEHNSRIIEDLQNDDGLVPSSELLIRRNDEHVQLSLRKFPKTPIFTHIQLSRVLKLLSADAGLWEACALRVAAMPSMVARATIFGVSLGKAFEQATKKGLQKARFALPDKSFDSNLGTQADLLLFVGTNKSESQDVRELQVWEEVRGSSEVFYAHAILSLNSNSVHHLDCAIMNLSDDQKDMLFNHARKLKGDSYKKYFRVESDIPISSAIELMRAYFPIDELTAEALLV